MRSTDTLIVDQSVWWWGLSKMLGPATVRAMRLLCKTDWFSLTFIPTGDIYWTHDIISAKAAVKRIFTFVHGKIMTELMQLPNSTSIAISVIL